MPDGIEQRTQIGIQRRFRAQILYCVAALDNRFRRVLEARTQVNGGLYSRAGASLAATNAAARLLVTGAAQSAYAGQRPRTRPQSGGQQVAPAEISLQARE